ncbi:MAG TPA: long-chain fatty acid--CoA ligase [Burkholderiales bacterium]|nr:long-chain fatty acid--CoA ligase [Burkholderiales bacterium]
MNLAQLLTKSARLAPDSRAIALGKTPVVSYGQLGDRVSRLAGGLRAKLNLAPGDRVGIAAKNCPEYYELMFACWHAGLVAVPMNAKLHPKELAYIVENSGAQACFTSSELSIPQALPITELARLNGEPMPAADVRPDDGAWLFYTSGTTGVPKGATLTHRNLLFMTHAYFADIDQLGPNDSILHPAPLSHGSGCYAIPHFAAGAVNVIPESASFEPWEIFDLLDYWHGSSFFAAPTMVVRLLASKAARPPKHLKTLIYGGAPMYVADSLRAIELFGSRLYQLFGQGEAPMTITGLPQDMHRKDAMERLATCGFARTGCEVKIVDGDERDLPAGELGEIVTRSDCVMAGYWQNPEASAKALRGGWLHTGDVGSMDAAGFLTIRDRSKDMIISGGSNIYPREIEEVLLRHPAVAECSVIGRPHAEWGEEVVAFVVAKQAVSTEELDQLCLDNIARFKRPREYRFVEALPKNNYGKVLKTELRKLVAPLK